MKYEASTPKEYIDQIPEERKKEFTKLRNTLRENLPEGFSETMTYGMISFVVPHEIFPEGYHVNPKEPLPFISIASQKNFIALYHSGIYASEKLKNWFTSEYGGRSNTKLDMGKSCIRFKNPKNIPFDLISELAGKMSVQEWINTYNAVRKRNT